LNDPNVDTDVSFIDPSECPHAGIYQWTSYYTVPENMISDASLHYVPDFRITFSTDNGNRVGCTITGPIALRMIAAQKERDGMIAFGIALSIFVSIFGVLLLCSQYRRMSKRTAHGNNGMLLQPYRSHHRAPPTRHSGSVHDTLTTGNGSTLKHQQLLHHPYPYYNNNSSSRSRTSTLSSSGHYVRTLPNGQVVGPVFGPSSNHNHTDPNLPPLPPPHPSQSRRGFHHPPPIQHLNRRGSGNSNNTATNSHHHRVALTTSVEDDDEENDDEEEEEEYDDHESHEKGYVNNTSIDDDIDDADTAVSGRYQHHHSRQQYQPNRIEPRPQPPGVRSNPKYNETQLPSRPII
jgi:hypothetical protein